MSANPYTDLPSAAFWGEAVSLAAPGALDPCVRGEIIPPGAKIATMGSCFAQHLSAHVAQSGLTYFVPEAAPAGLSAADARALGYGVFSARYGNLYTARQLLQLFRRAYGLFAPADDVWESDGRYFDPFRPAIQPGGFATREEYRRDREQHFAAVRMAFEQADVFVFTLGLTECWASREDGAVYPLCPGVEAGVFDAARHEFLNFGVDDVRVVLVPAQIEQLPELAVHRSLLLRLDDQTPRRGQTPPAGAPSLVLSRMPFTAECCRACARGSPASCP